MVGARVVLGDKVVGQGYHRAAGEPHAEVHALAAAGSAARGATVYVNLEPCSHQGRTPPCAEALVAAEVGEVVYGMEDPNPRVAGSGLARLRDAGIRVRGPVLERECRAINEPFVVAMTKGRPGVSLKLALTLDGMIGDRRGHSHWITGPAARQRGHQLRAFHQAVLVGANTVRQDDPRLTPRDRGTVGRAAVVRLILSGGNLNLTGRRLLDDLPEHGLWLACPTGASPHPSWADARDRGARILEIDAERGSGPPRVHLPALLRRLHGEGIVALMCEGGADLAGRLLRAGLVDRLHVFRAPLILGGAGGRAGVADTGARALSEALRMRRVAAVERGPDLEEIFVPEGQPWADPS